MCHKAYILDSVAFSAELRPLLEDSLAANDATALMAFVDAQREHLTLPWEATPLPANWRDDLEQGDVQEVGDIALTKYYDADDDCGIQEHWRDVHEGLAPEVGAALLGEPLEANGGVFDPGRMGSYFQTPEGVRRSARLLQGARQPELGPFHALLSRAEANGKGLYVTF
jgi:hypothetical protein